MMKHLTATPLLPRPRSIPPAPVAPPLHTGRRPDPHGVMLEVYREAAVNHPSEFVRCSFGQPAQSAPGDYLQTSR